MTTIDARSLSDLPSPLRTAAASSRALAGGRVAFVGWPFLLGALAAQHVDVGGELYFGEVLGVLLAFSILRRKAIAGTERLLLYSALVWSATQLVSDIYNHTALTDSIKGVTAPMVFIVAILGFSAYFSDHPARMPSFLLGVAVGTLVSLAVFPSLYSSINAWKFGVGAAVIGVFSIHYSFFLRRKSLLWLFVALLSFLLVSLYYDSRSMAALPLLAGLAYALFRTGRGMRLLTLFRGKSGFVRLTAAIAMTAVLVNLGATALFSSDLVLSRVSPAAAQKYKTQAGGAFGVLLGGRADVLVSMQAFLDRPLLGHGSWARDTSGYRQSLARMLYKLGYATQTDYSPWIPAHSFLMGTLVWSGILGGLFWIALVAIVVQRFLKARGRLPLYLYIGTVAFLWDVLFSPFGASSRWSTAVFVAAFLAFTHVCKTQRGDE
jgi:hypothetical protein